MDKGDDDDDDNAAPGNAETAKEVRSPEEVAAEILALMRDGKRLKKLRQVARRYSGSHMEADDLLQRAFHLAVEDGSDKDQGRRRCPKDVEIVTFLSLSMRSISHGERAKQKRRGVHLVINTQGQELTVVDPPDPHPHAEELADANKTYRHVMSLFDGDAVAKAILEGIEAGLSAEKIREHTGLSEIAYNSKRRQIRRIIDRHYPAGWR